MNVIPGIERIKVIEPEFKLFFLKRIHKMIFSYDDESYNLNLVISTIDQQENLWVEIEFIYVSNLTIDGFGGGDFLLNGFDILNISDRNWEALNWEVVDFENNSFNFFANDVRIVRCKKET